MTATRSLPPASQVVLVAEANATLARILDAIEEYVYTGEFREDGQYQVVFAGPCREQFLGMSIEEARGAVWADYVHPDDVETFDVAHAAAHSIGGLDVEYRLIGADGMLRWVRDRGRIRDDGGRRFLDGSILDVTATHAAREELEAARAHADRLARTDALTGVANRRSLPELLADLDGGALGLLSLDVDRFKQINDLCGHACGDAVLVELVERIHGVLRSRDRIVRMGGEEFLILLPGVDDRTALLDVAEKVRSCVRAIPVDFGDQAVVVSVSIGATLAAPGGDFDAVLAVADRCMYAAKRAGRDRVQLAAPDAPDEDLVDEDSDGLRVALTLARLAAAAHQVPGERVADVSLLAARIARRLGARSFEVMRCRLGGLLRDVGTLQVTAGILTTPGALDAHETTLMRRHAEFGEQMVAAVPELAPVAAVVRHHHERYDGTGYPDGLAGEAIPLEARIVAVADTWHAMTADRPHRPALSTAQATTELGVAAGSQLDPTVVAALRAILIEPREPA